MKKKKSASKSEIQKLLADIEKQKALVKQQEERGNLGTYDHDKLARLEKAFKALQKNEVTNGS